MRTMIFSDVHGNLPAFEAALADAGPCDAYICLGDLVNYGPWSNECVDLAMSLPNVVLLMGNHETYFIEGHFSGQHELVKKFTEHLLPDFARREEISRFSEQYRLGKFLCQHTLDGERIFRDSNIQLNDNYCIGHSHQQFHIQQQSFDLYNTGSVGQSRDRLDKARYLLYERKTSSFELCETSYSTDALLQKMKTLDYPQDCLDYYLSKCPDSHLSRN